MWKFIDRILGIKETQIVEEIEPIRGVRRETPKKSKEELIAKNILRSLGKKLP